MKIKVKNKLYSTTECLMVKIRFIEMDFSVVFCSVQRNIYKFYTSMLIIHVIPDAKGSPANFIQQDKTESTIHC